MEIKRCTTIKGILVVTLLFTLLASASAQFPEAIVKATKNANAEALSEYFNNKIELVLPQKSGVFSDAQAKLVLNEFFKNNPVVNFSIIHQGVRENSSFAIGKYQTSSMAYRFYFLTKKTDNKTYIHQLRIEEQND
ncbi:protein of unknown function [Saccharicrinis carchari]|uniref:DUF4783 domain-containing protein n=1 Tax=Saccharicrinis carchari TaxID=1168039 RepID=A0A521E9Y6_SACCC|nr:DUF4783 domain-containing protein [Saccharicrinis carchari]SMO80261.1 protein of unknown function [Saccharicrinis carchari]